jgi:hypothetical protein
VVNGIAQAIQTSRPHPGLCDDLEHTINRLFEKWFYSLV